MNERLQNFIKSEGLTPGKFADIIGVQPSSISHLISGRNKPSYDFISKTMVRFPRLNPDWLLLGRGDMYRQNEIDAQISPGFGPKENLIEPQSKALIEPQPANIDIFSFDIKDIDAVNMEPVTVDSTSSLQSKIPKSSLKTETQSKSVATNHLADLITKDKGIEIEKIVIFYSNKTFKEYNPE